MSENMMNRPVTARDVANALNLPYGTVRAYLYKNSPVANKPGSKMELVRKTAEKMGYDPNAAMQWNNDHTAERMRTANKESEGKCPVCGKVFLKHSAPQKYCPACRKEHNREYQRKWAQMRYGRSTNYYNGNFKTKEEEVARMKELCAQGYSHAEIAKAIGRSVPTVRHAIGKQDRELWKQNVAMATKFRAQKNAARKQYVVNKPIREYNAKVEEHNKMKAELNRLQVEILTDKPNIEKAAQVQIDFPLIDLHTVQPTALQ